MAGDHIDDLLVGHILTKAGGYPDRETRERISRDLRRSGLRRDKETLFNTGNATLRLVTGQPVVLNLDEFLQTQGVVNFAAHIENELSEFLGRVDKSFAPVAEQPTMLLSGGGANLPFIKALAKRRWIVAGRDVLFRQAKAIPDAILQYDEDFRREYPQLAVAMGGAMQTIDEKAALEVFGGTTERFGGLTKYAVTGG